MTRRSLPLILAVAFALSFGHAAVTADSCRSLHVADTTDVTYEQSQALIARGWYGVPGDGQERLYSPACRD